MSKKLKYLMEAGTLKIIFALFTILPLEHASNFGSFLARFAGRLLPAHRTAYNNLSKVFPNLSHKEKKKILMGMWDNLGRNAAELAHLLQNDFVKKIKIIGAENLPKKEKSGFMFSAHIGNWELLACAAKHHNRPITGIYREANNPIVDGIISKIRSVRYFSLIPKGRQGAVKIARAIKNNEAFGMLVDQKMNDGIEVPFFDIPAMTAPAIAEFALRYDAPIIPARVIRKNGVNFEVIIYPQLEYEKTGDKEKDVYNIMLKVNQILEKWIKEYPEQWFWVHKRWSK